MTSLARYHFTRAALLEQMGDRKAAVRGGGVVTVVVEVGVSYRPGQVRCYRRLLGELGGGQGEDFLQVRTAPGKSLTPPPQATRQLATLLHKRENLAEAEKVFGQAFDRFPECVNNDDTNLYLELLIEVEKFDKALEVGCHMSSFTSHLSPPT